MQTLKVTAVGSVRSVVVRVAVALGDLAVQALGAGSDRLPGNVAVAADAKLRLAVADDLAVRSAGLAAGSRSGRCGGRGGCSASRARANSRSSDSNHRLHGGD